MLRNQILFINYSGLSLLILRLKEQRGKNEEKTKEQRMTIVGRLEEFWSKSEAQCKEFFANKFKLSGTKTSKVL